MGTTVGCVTLGSVSYIFKQCINKRNQDVYA